MNLKKRIAIVTDSNSGITEKYAKKNNIKIIPMPFYIKNKLFFENKTLTQKEFYNILNKDIDIFTSQPSPNDILKVWNKLLIYYNEIIYIPMSSSLSNSYKTALMLSKKYKNNCIQVVNNKRISVTQKQSVYDAINLVKHGKNAKEIKKILESERYQAVIYITLKTLKYLKKGGRITHSVALLNNIFNIQPILQINGEKLDFFLKAKNREHAKKLMIKAIDNDLQTRFKNYNNNFMILEIAYTNNYNEALKWKKKVEIYFNMKVNISALPLSISCHIGEYALAISAIKKIKV